MSATTTMASAADLLGRLPGEVTEQWPEGLRSIVGLRHGTMTVKLFAPRGIDRQSPHVQDEVYLVISGSGNFVLDGQRHPFEAGAAFFVPAQVAHRFEDFTPDFVTWVVFWGPEGGEREDVAR